MCYLFYLTTSLPILLILFLRPSSSGASSFPLFWREERCWDRPPPDSAAAAPPPQAIPAGDPRKGGGEGWTGKPSSRKRSISPARDITAPQEAESIMPRRFRSPAAPLPPAPLAPRRGRAGHVPRGRLPAGNEAIDQNGQQVVGRRRTPPSSPLQFSQPTNPPIFLYNSANRPTH